jgi:hypothetical protein
MLNKLGSDKIKNFLINWVANNLKKRHFIIHFLASILVHQFDT